MPITERPPAQNSKGQVLRSFLLTDASSPNMACQITNQGATITHLWVPDKQSNVRDIVLGFDDLTAYRSDLDPYFGASVGRTANRIAKGEFTLPDQPGTVYRLDCNNGPNSLHGGIDGFSCRLWDVESATKETFERGTSIRMGLLSEHMDQGFPGRLKVYCTVRLIEYTLEISYEACLDSNDTSLAKQATIASLTNHSYFNLNGVPTNKDDETAPSSTALVTNHVMKVQNIDSYLETDSTSIPTGKILPLEQVPSMDFRTAKEFGQDIKETPGGGIGYDHFYPVKQALENPEDYGVKNDIHRQRPVPLVSVYSPDSGIQLDMATTEPGFQLYTANWVQVDRDIVDVGATSTNPLMVSEQGSRPFTHVGKARGGYQPHSGFCLETSKFPDAIHHETWKQQVILQPGDRYESLTTFKFSTK
ncbi:aldose 1-epimerase [Entomortierella parvispora]|uniref:Aldose 1-epimerase n=1 Tax=Entomortierella parvispora TaxID=205924 RepID=A0A9P3H466_9FUNG|nr:aldose 1-epimerase [Entomortierella parvispora]